MKIIVKTLQEDIVKLGNRPRKWDMGFQLWKCIIMHLTRNRAIRINTAIRTLLENIDNAKYLVVSISSDLQSNPPTQIIHAEKTNKIQGLLKKKPFKLQQIK